MKKINNGLAPQFFFSNIVRHLQSGYLIIRSDFSSYSDQQSKDTKNTNELNIV